VSDASLPRLHTLPAIWIGRAYRVAMIWQTVVVALIAIVALALFGTQGLYSAVLGGSIGVISVLVFGLVSKRGADSSGNAIRVALRAEAAKVIAVVVLLWLSFAFYRDLVVPAFMAAFIVSVLLAGIAFAVSSD
jgi:ATP synthase protein I